MGDRTDFAPNHLGENVLPGFPLFTRLLTNAYKKPQNIAIRDVNLNSESTYTQLLTDVLSLRRSIESLLDDQALQAIRNRDEVYIVVVASGGYEFAVGVLAVLALGAAAVPLSMALCSCCLRNLTRHSSVSASQRSVLLRSEVTVRSCPGVLVSAQARKRVRRCKTQLGTEIFSMLVHKRLDI
jgi:acyl-CoA synthetase (AMP-forming)/AMP-acid ligase II